MVHMELFSMCNLSLYHYMKENLQEPLVLRRRIQQGAVI